jgi:hypothetical protein
MIGSSTSGTFHALLGQAPENSFFRCLGGFHRSEFAGAGQLGGKNCRVSESDKGIFHAGPT